MRLYESVFIARQDITSAQVEALADEFAEIITSAGGSIKKREHWGLRSLAYRIKKNRKGHYVMFNMETGPEALREYCLLYTSPSPRDATLSRMPSSA